MLTEQEMAGIRARQIQRRELLEQAQLATGMQLRSSVQTDVDALMGEVERLREQLDVCSCKISPSVA